MLHGTYSVTQISCLWPRLLRLSAPILSMFQYRSVEAPPAANEVGFPADDLLLGGYKVDSTRFQIELRQPCIHCYACGCKAMFAVETLLVVLEPRLMCRRLRASGTVRLRFWQAPNGEYSSFPLALSLSEPLGSQRERRTYCIAAQEPSVTDVHREPEVEMPPMMQTRPRDTPSLESKRGLRRGELHDCRTEHLSHITHTPWIHSPASLAHSMGKLREGRVMKWTQAVSKAPP